MIKLGQSQERLVLNGGATALDAEPDLLNVQNGILDLRTLELSEHDPSRCMTKVARAEYQADAEAPFFEECVEKALPDKDVRRWVQKAAGYSMRGQYSEYLFIPFGGGANLKSTLLYGMRYALGDYAAEAASDLLVARREWGAAAESALAGLRGSRFVTTIETEQGKRMAEVLVKQLTGEQDITAKFMRQDYFSYQNQAAVWLATNHKPIVQGMDFAIWRRVKLIPFDYQVPDRERLEHDEVNRRLRGERDGILRWLVAGLKMYLEDGALTPEPQVIRDATDSYRKEMDSLGEWLEDECVVEEGAWEEYARLRESYVKWCKNSREPLGEVRFRQELDRRDFVSKRGRPVKKLIRYRSGLRLRTELGLT